MVELLRSLLRPIASQLRRAQVFVSVLQLRLANRYFDHHILSSDGPIVSIATYSKRLDQVFLTIESIGRGDLRPKRLLLWVGRPEEYASLPVTLRRLQKRGLEIRLSERDFGPHKKYYPYLKLRDAENSTSPLVTADDDVIYPSNWLQSIVAAYRKQPEFVHCYRARIVQCGPAGLAPYAQWPLCRSDEPSLRTFAIGVSGVLYPPQMLEHLDAAGDAFEQLCPKADDIWLHRTALRNGFKVKQLSRNPVHFPIIPGTQEAGLQQQNLHSDGNDAQAGKTYSVEDLATLCAAPPPQ